MIERAQGSTTPIRFRIEAGDAGQVLTGATVTMYLIDTQYWQGEDFDPPYAAHGLSFLPPTTIKVKGATCVPDADQVNNPGVCSWTPGASDLDTPGDWWMQPKVAYSDGTVDAPPPIRLRVYPTIFSLA